MTEKPVTTGVFDTLPDAADMPRIMDERTTQEFMDGKHRSHQADCSCRICAWENDTERAARLSRIDTRTRAQLDDGCVTGCSCNGFSD